MVGYRRGLYLHRTTQRINTRDKHTCRQRDSNPRSQQPRSRKPYALDGADTVTSGLFFTLNITVAMIRLEEKTDITVVVVVVVNVSLCRM
jgi:hypothetical protein